MEKDAKRLASDDFLRQAEASNWRISMTRELYPVKRGYVIAPNLVQLTTPQYIEIVYKGLVSQDPRVAQRPKCHGAHG